jgi:hypothetical protein
MARQRRQSPKTQLQLRIELEHSQPRIWRHKIRVEAEVPLVTAPSQALCLAGEMVCPPEDVGGIPGYFAFLEAVSDPSHEEHAEVLEWCGGEFDPCAFDIVATNALLASIKL